MKSKSWCSPGQLLMLMLAGWINRHQQAVIAYQKEEIKVLREMLGGQRLRFADEQRRRLVFKPSVVRGDHHGLQAAVDAEFLQDVLDVRAGRR
jgi:hypothetical protein